MTDPQKRNQCVGLHVLVSVGFDAASANVAGCLHFRDPAAYLTQGSWWACPQPMLGLTTYHMVLHVAMLQLPKLHWSLLPE